MFRMFYAFGAVLKAAWAAVVFVCRLVLRSGRILALLEVAQLLYGQLDPAIWQGRAVAHANLTQEIGRVSGGQPLVVVIVLVFVSAALLSSRHELADTVISWLGISVAFFSAWLTHGSEGVAMLGAYAIMVVAVVAATLAIMTALPQLVTAALLVVRR